MTWTPEKPTKPGRYELSIEPGKRKKHWMPGMAEIYIYRTRGGKMRGKISGRPYFTLEEVFFDGAQWRQYQEPADPFAHPVAVTNIELPHDRGSLRIEDDGESVKAVISPSIAGGMATDRLRNLRAAVLSAGEWLTRLCDRG